MLIDQMKFEVCSICQNRCGYCAHGQMIKDTKGYQLSIEKLEEFIYYTEKSNYFIRNLRIHGVGEPLLWKYFNQGIQLLDKSNSIGEIFVSTNGYNLDVIEPKTWECIDEMRISFYNTKVELIYKIKEIYGDKVRIEDKQLFRKFPDSDTLIDIPCKCTCSGPMYFDDHIFYYCGPPVFYAAHQSNLKIWNEHYLYTKIGLYYLDSLSQGMIGNMKLCRKCWANSNISRDYVNNDVSSGDW